MGKRKGSATRGRKWRKRAGTLKIKTVKDIERKWLSAPLERHNYSALEAAGRRDAADLERTILEAFAKEGDD